MNYVPHQQRVIDEAKELGDRLKKLDAFIDSEKFKDIRSEVERGLLRRQAYCMHLYEKVLHERIALGSA